MRVCCNGWAMDILKSTERMASSLIDPLNKPGSINHSLTPINKYLIFHLRVSAALILQQIQLPAKLLDFFEWSDKSKINQCQRFVIHISFSPLTPHPHITGTRFPPLSSATLPLSMNFTL